MTTAFVLGGGGNLGAVQVGMLRALLEHDITPDAVFGCSVGALNGAALCEDPTLENVERLIELWRNLHGKNVMPTGWFSIAVQMARRGEALHTLGPLRDLIESFLTAREFDELQVHFECVATAIDEAAEVWLDRGSLVDAILASSAIPSVYPSVLIDGVRYRDGAIVNDIPISRAVDYGAKKIYVIHVGTFDRPRLELKRPLDVAVEAYWIARRHRFIRDLHALPPHVDAVLLPPGEPPRLPINDFTHSDELMTNAYLASTELLDELSARRK
ncbi:MAG TPA: patatin-like phospholipase family protein [Acidimicrobiales bacterium]|jgi:NTE family protein|nr:patatin-like phospholipase family protein [Acidimicrobiales bacterium]